MTLKKPKKGGMAKLADHLEKSSKTKVSREVITVLEDKGIVNKKTVPVGKVAKPKRRDLNL